MGSFPIPNPTPYSLIPDLGTEISNTYCTQAYADTYWAEDYRSGLSAQWAALDDTQKTKLLIAACRDIEQLRFTIPQTLPAYAMHYDRRTLKVVSMNLTRQPVKYYYYQRLQFPRNLDVYYLALPSDITPPPNWGTGQIYIPDEIMRAQCEQAMYRLTLDTSDIQAQLQGIAEQSVVLGKQDVAVTTKYAPGANGTNLSSDTIALVSPFVVRNSKLLRA